MKEGGPATQRLDSTSSSKQTALAGLLVRRYRWGLSARGFLVYGFSLATVFVVFVLESYPFLAITSRAIPLFSKAGCTNTRCGRQQPSTQGITIGAFLRLVVRL